MPTIVDNVCETTFRTICYACANAFEASLAVFLETEDPLGPHKARVALRRLTTALDAFQPILRRKRAAALRARSKRIFRDLGLVRDSDVHLGATDVHPGGRRLFKANRNLREKIREKVRRNRAVLLSQDLRVAVMEGGTIYRRSLAAQKRRRVPTQHFSTDVLRAAWKRCLSYGPSVLSIPADDRHEFRKEIKTLRYLTEFFGEIIPTIDDSFRSELQDIQTALGRVNDYQIISALDGGDPPSELPDHVRDALERAEAVWAQLAANPPPWSRQSAQRP